MADDLSTNPLLQRWSVDIMTGLFQTDGYRLSPPDPATASTGATTLFAQLHPTFVPALADYVRQSGVPFTPAIVAGHRGHRANSPFQKGARLVADRIYNPVLIADLGDLQAPRHEVAQIELFALTQSHLRQAKGPNDIRLHELIDVADLLAIDEDDLYRDFFQTIWPKMLRGDHPLRHPFFLHGYLKEEAKGFLSHRICGYRTALGRLASLQATPDEPNPEMDTLIENAAWNDPTRFRWYETESVAIDNLMREDLIQRTLDAYLPEDRENRLGFLIYLLQRIDMPNLSILGIPKGGIHQETAALLQRWREDPKALATFLLDQDRGLGLPGPLVEAILSVTAEGFANAPDPIDTDFVRNLSKRYLARLEIRLAALRDRLQDTNDHPESTQDERTEAEHG
jgi:hypothetical protein